MHLHAVKFSHITEYSCIKNKMTSFKLAATYFKERPAAAAVPYPSPSRRARAGSGVHMATQEGQPGQDLVGGRECTIRTAGEHLGQAPHLRIYGASRWQWKLVQQNPFLSAQARHVNLKSMRARTHTHTHIYTHTHTHTHTHARAHAYLERI
jgi:hypothetical protein